MTAPQHEVSAFARADLPPLKPRLNIALGEDLDAAAALMQPLRDRRVAIEKAAGVDLTQKDS